MKKIELELMQQNKSELESSSKVYLRQARFKLFVRKLF
jgi:hypothetical protein